MYKLQQIVHFYPTEIRASTKGYITNQTLEGQSPVTSEVWPSGVFGESDSENRKTREQKQIEGKVTKSLISKLGKILSHLVLEDSDDMPKRTDHSALSNLMLLWLNVDNRYTGLLQ